MAAPVQAIIESLPSPQREEEIRRLIQEKKDQIAALEELLPHEPCTIILNGEEWSTPERELSYDDILEWAYGPGMEGRVLTVVTHNRKTGAGRSLIRGQSVKVEEGLVISAYDTSNA